ncbi:MAG: ABC transporter ATP-binding protein, partial [Firmicutes bacterium]|nr:ABC transporter ATP-binding protein [Bacillota bacterium]
MSEELLRLEHLSIDYKVKGGYLSAVNDVNLSVNRGEILAVVGESGCGKSTIAHSIMNLLPGGNEEVEGKILFKGEDLRKYSRKQMEAIRGKDIGMIFQNPLDSLNPVYKTGKQVEEAILLDGIDRVQAWNKVLELYKDVKMPDAEVRANSFPHELSGGMRQRVMIAMMLSRNPELLIADEPTTALDVTIEAQILEIIKDLKKTYDTAIMLITHNFG